MANEHSVARAFPWGLAAVASGMVFVVIALVAFLISLGPDDTSGQGIASYFAQNDNAVEWQQFLFGVSGIFFIWFAGTVATILRRSESGDEARLGGIAFAGAAASMVIYFVGLSCWTTMAHLFGGYGGNQFTEAALGDALTLFNLADVALAMAGFTAVIFVGAASIAFLRSALVADWLAWAGGAVALLLLVDAFLHIVGDSESGDFLGTAAFLLFLAWVFAASALLARNASRVNSEARGVTAAR